MTSFHQLSKEANRARMFAHGVADVVGTAGNMLRGRWSTPTMPKLRGLIDRIPDKPTTGLLSKIPSPKYPYTAGESWREIGQGVGTAGMLLPVMGGTYLGLQAAANKWAPGGKFTPEASQALERADSKVREWFPQQQQQQQHDSIPSTR